MCGILIVDDDASIRFAMADYFAAKGHRADSVASREQAEAHLHSGHYGVVITDLRLTPSGDAEGLEIVRLVSQRHSGVACIVLTAYGSPASEAAARRHGATEFLHKPRPMAELLDTVSKLLPGGACRVAAARDVDVTDAFRPGDSSLSLAEAQRNAPLSQPKPDEPAAEEPTMSYQTTDETVELIWRDLAERVARSRVAEVAQQVASSFGDVKITTFAPLFVRRLAVDRLRPEAALRA